MPRRVQTLLFTGEVELDRDQITEVGVHLAARVMAQAGPGQILASSTVRDLMAGSGLGFVDLGVRELKGFAERWLLRLGSKAQRTSSATGPACGG